MLSFNFTSQRPVALTREGGLVEFTEGVDIAVPVAATQVTVAPMGGIAATDAQAALAELDAEKQPLDADLTAVAGLTGSGWPHRLGDANWVLAPALVLNDLADVILSPDTPAGKVLGATATGVWGAVDPPASGEPAGTVAAHAAGTGVHTIAGVTGLQAALDGKSATGHLHPGVYEPAGAVATHAALTVVHGISAFGATLVDDASAAAARTTLELGTAATTAATAYEPAGTVATHAAAAGAHTIAGVTGLQTALDGKSATSHLHTGVYEPAGAVATHAGAANAHAIAGVTGLQAALDGAVKLSPPADATQAISGLITLHGAYPALGFNALTLNLSPTGSLSPANPLGGNAFSTWSALIDYVNERLVVASLKIVAEPGTYVELNALNLSDISCSSVTIESSGTVVIDASAVPVLWATFNQSVAIKCPMTISAATRVWTQNDGSLLIQAPVTMTSLALASAGTLRVGGGALAVSNTTLTLNQPAGNGPCLYAGGIDHYANGATASIIANKASANDAIVFAGGVFRLVGGGTISTPGLGKTINVGNVAQDAITVGSLLNGATLTYQHISPVTNGWWRHPASKLILQWGNGATNSSGTVVQTLPIAFTTSNLIVSATARATTVGAFTTTNQTLTGFTVNSYKLSDGTALPTASFSFIAIGY